MLAYTTVGTNDYPKATEFYDALLSEMGAKRLWQDERFASYGLAMDRPMFAVCTPDNGAAATVGNGTMITLSCSDTDMVHKLHERALELGGSCEGNLRWIPLRLKCRINELSVRCLSFAQIAHDDVRAFDLRGEIILLISFYHNDGRHRLA